MSELRTDFKDDVLDVTQNERRKYRIIHNDDGTISLEDATVYVQKGDNFGANELNEMNEVTNQMLGVNEKLDGFDEHTKNIIPSENGSHGIRYFNNKLEIQDGEEYNEIKPITLKTSDNDYGVLGIEFKQEELTTNDRIWKSQATLPAATMRSTGQVTALVYEDEIHLFGGGKAYNDYYNSTNHRKLRKGTTNTWDDVSTLPEYASTATFFVHDDKIHMVTSSGYYMYDDGSWTQITTVTVPYQAAFMSEDGLHIVHFTYYSYETKNTHYRYNGDGWIQVNVACPSMFMEARQTVIHNGEFHVLGSISSSYGPKYHYKWNGESWTSVSTLWGEWYGGSVLSYKGKIHVLGGYGNSNNNTSHYILDGTTWTLTTKLPYYFTYGAATIYDDVVHIIGSDYNLGSQVYTYAMSHYYLTANKYNRYTDITLLKEDGTTQFNNNGWTKLTKGSSDTTVYLPTNFKEIYVEDVISSIYVGQVIPKECITSTTKTYRLYFAYSTSGSSAIDIKVNLDYVTLYSSSGNVYFR